MVVQYLCSVYTIDTIDRYRLYDTHLSSASTAGTPSPRRLSVVRTTAALNIVWVSPPVLSERVVQKTCFSNNPSPLLPGHAAQTCRSSVFFKTRCPNILLKHAGRAAGVPTAVSANAEARGDSERPVGLHQGHAGTSAEGDQIVSNAPPLFRGGSKTLVTLVTLVTLINLITPIYYYITLICTILCHSLFCAVLRSISTTYVRTWN